MLEVRDITKSFGQTRAVDGVSFSVDKGQIVGFLGPNGAGKTTTMRIITGYLAPDRGRVVIDGQLVDWQDTKPHKKIGYLAENNPLYADFLVSEMLTFAADLKDIDKKKRPAVFEQIVEAVGIKDVFYRPIRELSKGYKQRVGLALALMGDPSVIIMDEPTEGLDPNQRSEIRALIKKLARDRTIIMSTHVMQEAAYVCGRLLIINKGKIVADGSVDELTRIAEKERTLLVEIEGPGVELQLRSLAGINHIDVEKSAGGRVQAKLLLAKDIVIEPEISRLAREQNWIIWHISEEKYGLEEVFHKLTSEL